MSSLTLSLEPTSVVVVRLPPLPLPSAVTALLCHHLTSPSSSAPASPLFVVSRTPAETSVVCSTVEASALADAAVASGFVLVDEREGPAAAAGEGEGEGEGGDPRAQARLSQLWSVFRVHGPLPFTMTGVLAGLAAALAASGVPIFAASTYTTPTTYSSPSRTGKGQRGP
jgi:hypothetical protein